VKLGWLRRSVPALMLATLGWSAGCATTPHPMVDAGFGARAYTPGRVTVLPPDVFVVVDRVGDNDPAQGTALSQQVSAETLRAAEGALRARGYDVDLSARWDGIYAQDGTMLVSRDELGWLANGVVSLGNSPQGGAQGAIAQPLVVAPELAARVGWATQSDALLYINVKGALATPGKQATAVVAAVLIVFIVIAVVLMASSNKGHGGSGFPQGSGHPQPISRAPTGAWHGSPSGWHGTPGGAPRPVPAPTGSGWRGGGAPPPVPSGAPVYRGGPRVGVGVGVVVPLDGPTYTHDGNVGYEDPMFAGDEIYVAMTMVSTYDGRVLWHVRDHVDVEADHPEQVERMIHTFLDTLPPALPRPPAAAPATAR
jgi:hypothetical protein